MGRCRTRSCYGESFLVHLSNQRKNDAWQILAGAFSRLLKDHPENAAGYGGAAAAFIFLYTAIFGATWLTIPWVYPTEVCFITVEKDYIDF